MRRIVGLFAAIALLGVFAGPVAAASPPSNDEATGATVIPADTILPFSTTENTAGATANASDLGCSGSFGQATVWYTYVAAAGAQLAIDASATMYGVEVDVFTGTPADLSLLTCGSPTAVFGVPESTTYYFMFAEVDGGSAGGTLAFTLEIAPPPPTVHLTISPTGSANPKAGTVTIKGTIDCGTTAAGIAPDSTPPGFGGVEVDVFVTQKVGRVATIQGYSSWFAETCTTDTPWQILVLPMSGLFKPAPVNVSGQAMNCDALNQCAFDMQEAVVRLTRR